jgi:hypothetical protein
MFDVVVTVVVAYVVLAAVHVWSASPGEARAQERRASRPR